jgi:hypothetical protein
MSGKKAKAARKEAAHPATDHPAFYRTHNVAEAAETINLPATFRISEYHPLPNGEGRPTQVVLIVSPAAELDLGPIQFCVALKSKAACQALIDVLADHRNNVWGDT